MSSVQSSNASYDLAVEYVRQEMERIIAESRSDDYHEALSNPTRRSTDVRVGDLQNCDCVPLNVSAGGCKWELLRAEWNVNRLRLMATYRTRDAAL